MKRSGQNLFIIFMMVLAFGIVNVNHTISVDAATPSISLGFVPFDTEVDPDQPIVYMTELNSKTLYAANYETGVVKKLTLPYLAERMTLYKGKLYVTQHKTPHYTYNNGPYDGAIAEVNTSDFTLADTFDVEADPYDLAVDKDGILYITPGSGQFQLIAIYDLKDKKPVQDVKNREYRYLSNIYYSESASNMYIIANKVSPISIEGLGVEKGDITTVKDSQLTDSHTLKENATISPNGLNLYNNSGTVFKLSKDEKDNLVFDFQLNHPFNDFSFSSKDRLMFGANVDGGIDVYKDGENTYLYTIQPELNVQKIFYNNDLVALTKDKDDKYSLTKIEGYKKDHFEFMKAKYEFKQYSKYVPKELAEGTRNVEYKSNLILYFNQNIQLVDASKITVKGPKGNLPIKIEVTDGLLKLIPEDPFTKSSKYTLNVGAGAVKGYDGTILDKSSSIHFTTLVPAITHFDAYVSKGDDLLSYVFDAWAFGENPQYEFTLVSEDNSKKVVQPFSSKNRFVWFPEKNGHYTMLVSAKSKGSDVIYTRELTTDVNDTDKPKVAWSLSKETLTNQPVTIKLSASDDSGIYKIKMPVGEVENESQIDYKVTKNGIYSFIVEDQFGNASTQEVKVTNIDTTKPQLLLSQNTTKPTNKDITITVQASDNVAVKSIQLPNGQEVNQSNITFEASKSGSYIFVVTDTAGNQVTKSITINNIFKGKPTLTTVNAIDDTHIEMKGKATPNTTIYAKKDNEVIGSGNVSLKGEFSFKISKQKAGTKINVYVKDPLNNISKPKMMTVLDKTAPVKPKINTVKASSTVVTGKAEKRAKIYIYNGKNLVKKGAVNSKGIVRITIPKQKKNSNLTIYAVDQAKNKSKATYVKVK
ncbi:Ig-like domain-containing protein [Rummeliibacillus sp. NPDC094406]|uniref:Ig-like domain-containing protein n=1 Tax=Rummeliibacillus sp. NPDC094406 TaxID=3364511 RepID=UPI00381FBC5A